MFHENEELRDGVDSLVKMCRGKARGDIITHAEIRQALKCRPYEGCWSQAVAKMKRRVESELGVTLLAVTGVGYRFLSLDEQFDLAPRRRIRFAMRQIGRGIKHVEAPVAGDVPQHLQVRRAFVIESMRRRRSELHGETIRQGIFAKRQDATPRVSFFPPPATS